MAEKAEEEKTQEIHGEAKIEEIQVNKDRSHQEEDGGDDASRRKAHQHRQRRYHNRHYVPEMGDERGRRRNVRDEETKPKDDITDERTYDSRCRGGQGRSWRRRRNEGRSDNERRSGLGNEKDAQEIHDNEEKEKSGNGEITELIAKRNEDISKESIVTGRRGRDRMVRGDVSDDTRGETDRRRRGRGGKGKDRRERKRDEDQHDTHADQKDTEKIKSIKETAASDKIIDKDNDETSCTSYRNRRGETHASDKDSTGGRGTSDRERRRHTYREHENTSRSSSSYHERGRSRDQRNETRSSYKEYRQSRGYRGQRHNEGKDNKQDEKSFHDLKVATTNDSKMAATDSKMATDDSKMPTASDSATKMAVSVSKKTPATNELCVLTAGLKEKGILVISSTQSHALSQQLLSGTYDCSVCCDRLKHYQEVWSCGLCYHIFHLRCIRKWAHSSIATAQEDNPQSGWRCPCCQTMSTVIPSVYKCFCGRLNNPGQSRRKGDLTVPHSCGETCGRRLGSSPEALCRHKCQQLCHPGPCPPCAAMVTRTCPCGKESSYVRCSQYDVLPSCDNVCGKKLNCLMHRCTNICHKGPCPKCEVLVDEDCFCKRGKRSLACGSDSSGYSCGKLCNKSLSCGNHTCESPCHRGDCSPCSLLPSVVSHCPCGATPILSLLPEGVTRTSCLDDVPVCGRVCSKPLPCSSYTEEDGHLCQISCHTGPCPPCSLTSVALCACGRTQLKVPCFQIAEKEGFSCNRNCGKKLNCGRHYCNRKCCTSGSHVCERVCGRKHDCGCHACRDVCHPGMCGPCWNISYEELTCHCGGEVMLPPIPCGTAPPTCNRPCARIHSCDHPVTHTCHNDTCPPCTFLTDKACMGNHTVRQHIPCYLKDVSCGRPCGRQLSCGMHTCRKTCHKGQCEEEGGEEGKERERCKQLCTLKREYCDHNCSHPCHVGSPCPDTPCRAKVSIECNCGRLKAEVLCLASSSSSTSQAFHKLYGGNIGTLMREIQSGQCIKVDSITLKNVQDRKLDCDEECAQMERNRKLAEALELTNVDHTPHTAPQYSPFLLERAKFDPSFVSHVEETFKDLIETFRASPGRAAISHHFKPMKRDQRRLIHELAEVYQLSSMSYDPEPKRNVVVMATKKSLLPYVTLSQMTSRVKIMPPPLPLKYRLEEKEGIDKNEDKVTDSLVHVNVPDYFNDTNI